MRRQSGFTLLELLVAIAIFAFVAVMAYGGLNTVIRQGGIVQAATKALTVRQQGLRVLQQDLAFAVDRPVRDVLGGQVPAFLGGATDLLTLTRLDAANPWDKPRSQMARVFWRLTGKTLERAVLMPVDGTVNDSARPLVWHPLLTGVEALTLRFYDANNQSFEVWPPPNAPDAGLPKATELNITLAQMPPLRLTVPQVADWPKAQAPSATGEGASPGSSATDAGTAGASTSAPVSSGLVAPAEENGR
ncbi:type II secretion system protein GspJ [Halothiobacillus diazotrophicus]|uniref:Type II secretion system protein J n=1 Tax=Halothiobacillus diazotrophicus TaxID=1860122 RepID=A0A191ZHU9_9GAMM|nr:type II secretion system minor pseudopilin GspJ [Halothiobacillus diazotrophicus]ANJ67423.1 type II secretion system protein GspJ [Halothiobacillus diazotrophicus]